MKKLFTLTALAAASLLIATRSDAQVYIHAQIGFPRPRVYVAPPPVVYSEPAPVYQEPYDDQDAYVDPNGYPSSDGVVYEDQFPGYAYYDFPAWNGHYRDYWYYAHYRPFFERRYAGYFNGGRFDRGRFLGARYGHGYAGGAFANRGYVNHSYANRGNFANHGGGFVNHGGNFANHGGGFVNHGGGFENHGGGGSRGGAERGGFGGHSGGFGGHSGGGHGGGHGGHR